MGKPICFFVSIGIYLLLSVGCAGPLGSTARNASLTETGGSSLRLERRPFAATAEDSVAQVEHAVAAAGSSVDEEILFEEPPGYSDRPSSGIRLAKKERDASIQDLAHGRAQAGSPEASRLSAMSKVLRCLQAEGVWGYRSDVKATLEFETLLSMGFRRSEEQAIGFARVGDLGPVETIAVGNLRATFGEGLVLGRRDPDAAPRCFGKRWGTFRAAPSLSRWEQTKAAAIQVNPGVIHVGALTWRRPDAETGARRDECWLSVSLPLRGWWVGLAGGMELPNMRAGSANDAVPAAVSVALGTRRPGKLSGGKAGIEGFSGEMALLGGQLCFVAGAAVRSGGEWWIRLFNQPAPKGFGSSVNGLLRVSKMLQGGTLRWGKRIGRVKAILSVHDRSLRRAAGVTRYRRCSLFFRVRRKNAQIWEGSVSHVEAWKTAFGSAKLETAPAVNASSESRLRLRWAYDPRGALTHNLRVNLRIGPGGRISGILIAAGARLSWRRFEAIWRASNYTLASGRSAFVSRPGIGAFEYLAMVYRDGSDVSLRVVIKASSSCEILGYYGKPWEKEARLYVGMRWRG
ncbi:MAG: hypothetical protein GTO51_01325 [Candidatus Latescibacteria bacterium]|nr:hypothetical protein [Candidatus Latescibacterota bacterium]NIM21641.1 hypothetical protein [Candidatus Latescibacterota bacterium]NIM64620.1 hypothetical protein [Candidatus Latescibacterota bacterium]NIO01135.1 hypothetical protein [Candidatus Latescibacterota bacterium]NIO27528.1 hypothetical protein [Candidatus Latescibacterota bacterium]